MSFENTTGGNSSTHWAATVLAPTLTTSPTVAVDASSSAYRFRLVLRMQLETVGLGVYAVWKITRRECVSLRWHAIVSAVPIVHDGASWVPVRVIR